MEFCILTAARSGEVLGARWSEIDLKNKIWTVPANRMKAGHEHRVPFNAFTFRWGAIFLLGNMGIWITEDRDRFAGPATFLASRTLPFNVRYACSTLTLRSVRLA